MASDAVKTASAKDFARHNATKALALEAAAVEGNAKEVHQCLRSMKPWQPRRQMRLADSSGVVAPTFVREQEIVRDHSSSLLHGKTMSFADLARKERADTGSRASVPFTEFDIQCVPSLPGLVSLHSIITPSRGVGENGIGGEAYKIAPRCTASVVFPLHVKAALQLRYPLQWRGGQLMALWKGKGSTSDIRTYGDITLTEQNWKVAARLCGSYSVLV